MAASGVTCSTMVPNAVPLMRAVGDAHHVLHAGARELPRDRDVAGFGHAGRALRTDVLQHQHVVGVHVEVAIVDARREVLERSRRRPRAPRAPSAPRRRRLLDDRAARREVAAQHGDAALRIDRIGDRPHHVLRRSPGRRARAPRRACGRSPSAHRGAAAASARAAASPCRRPRGSPPCSAGRRASGRAAPASRGPCGRAPSRSISKPRRPAIAVRWTMPLVEPPIASSTRIAFSNAAGVRILSIVSRSRRSAPPARRSASAMRMRSAVTAGGEAPPGSVMPSASAMQAMVLAVPITEQVPDAGDELVVDVGDLLVVDLAGAKLAPVAPAVGAGADPLAAMRAGEHRAR